MLFTIPEPPPVPPYLRWQFGEILHDDGETLRVWADCYLLASGWVWSAKVNGYHREHDGTFRPVRETKGGEGGFVFESSAKIAAETWIREQVAALGVSDG